MGSSPSDRVLRKISAAPPVSMRTDEYEYVQLIVLAVAVGILGAVGNLGFRALIQFFSWAFRTVEWNALGIGRGGWFRLATPIVLLSGAGALLLLDRMFPGDVLGYGFPHFLEQVNLGSARFRRRWIVVKALGAAVSLGAGASVGREGPIAQIGGAIGSAVAQFRNLAASRAKMLVAAGAGAGIATTFNAPMGGLMFAWEIVLLGETEIASMTLLLVATFSAVVAERAIVGDPATFHPAVFVMRSYWEMLTYGLMGAMLGAMSAGYIRFFHLVAGLFRRLKLPAWTKLAVGLVLVGLIAAALPENLSDGYPVIDRALVGEFGFALLASLTLAKIVASSISLGSGAPGGVFGPIFFIGTTAGGAFRFLAALILPGLTGPRGSYALVGLGGFLAGVMHAPLTALFLLFEMTRLDFDMVLPTMITVLGSLIVSRAIERESIDTYALARQGKTLQISRDRLILTQTPVEAVMNQQARVVRSNATLIQVLEAAGDTEQSTLPVLDDKGVLKGVIVTRDLLAAVGSGRELGPLAMAIDVARKHPPTVTPQATLDECVQVMEDDGLDELPVVEAAGAEPQMIGLVTRNEVARTLNRVSVSLSALASSDNNIFWASGFRVSRIKLPSAANNKTLVELNPRARFGVSVLAVQSADDPEAGFVPIDPSRRLKTGDTIVASGKPQAIRQFQRELEQENK